MFELQARNKGLSASPTGRRRTAPRWCGPTKGACARSSSTCSATRSNSPQRGGVTFQRGMPARHGHLRHPRHRPRHPCRRPRAHLRALRPRQHGPGGRQRRRLTIARMLTDLMGGEMQVSSTPGVGTCSASGCSCRGCISPRPPANCPLATASATSRVRRRILVVDNERPTASCCRPCSTPRLHRRTGGQRLRVPGRSAALRAHLIFMDLGMPGIDGWETIRRLRQQRSATPIAILSANAFDKGLDNDVGHPPTISSSNPCAGRTPRLAGPGSTWPNGSPPAPAAVPARPPPANRRPADSARRKPNWRPSTN